MRPPKPWQRPQLRVRQRLPARKTMTIAAGFLCTDGLLMCADTEVNSGTGKYQSSKIRYKTQDDICEYLVSGTGNTGYIGMASDMIEHAIYDGRASLLASADSQNRSERFHRRIQRTVTKLYQHMRDTYPYETDKPFLELMIGVRFTFPDQTFDRSPQLMHVGSDGSVEWVDQCVIGMGDSIARSYLSILHTNQLTLEIMRPLALFVLYQAKRTGSGCGGGTHVYTLPRRGWSMYWNESKIAELVERAMQLCMVDARDASNSTGVVEAMADRLKADIMELRNSVDIDERRNKWALEAIEIARKQDPQFTATATPDAEPNTPTPSAPQNS